MAMEECCIPETCACFMKTAPPKIKHSSAGVGLCAVKTSHNGKDFCAYYGILTHHYP